MKLLHKTTRLYLLFSALMLAVTGCVLYVLLTQIIEAEITEKLLVNKERIVRQLKAGKAVPSLPPVIEIEETETQSPDTFFIRNTALFDPEEGETEPFLEVRCFESINGKTYVITLRQVVLEPHDYLNSIGLVLAVGLALLLLGLLWQNWRISKIIWQPFFENLEVLKHFKVQNEQPERLSETNVSEFRELNVAIEKLTRKARSDYRSLKEFTENASHEMQTPLAVIRAKLEEALQSPKLTEQQARQLETANSAVQRLARLNRSLLLLAKIENHQFPEMEAVSVLSQINQQNTNLEDFIKEKQLTLKMEVKGEAIVKSHPVLMETLLSNLLSNAIRHNVTGGEIEVVLSENLLVISNTGASSGLPSEQMFERFRKSNGQEASVGLGLAIAKTICDNYGWELNYHHESGRHIFSVVF